MTPPRMKRDNGTFGDWLRQRKWLTVIALPVLLISTYYGFYAAWGLLFIFWGITSTLSGEVFLIEPVNRRSHPVLFWLISAMWIGFGVLYGLADIYPEY